VTSADSLEGATMSSKLLLELESRGMLLELGKVSALYFDGFWMNCR
jgi:hypothetical protein